MLWYSARGELALYSLGFAFLYMFLYIWTFLRSKFYNTAIGHQLSGLGQLIQFKQGASLLNSLIDGLSPMLNKG